MSFMSSVDQVCQVCVKFLSSVSCVCQVCQGCVKGVPKKLTRGRSDVTDNRPDGQTNRQTDGRIDGQRSVCMCLSSVYMCVSCVLGVCLVFIKCVSSVGQVCQVGV